MKTSEMFDSLVELLRTYRHVKRDGDAKKQRGITKSLGILVLKYHLTLF